MILAQIIKEAQIVEEDHASADSSALLSGYPGMYHTRPSEAGMVPQMSQQQFTRLTTSQQAELELARRRAQKAAEGKRANATAAR